MIKEQIFKNLKYWLLIIFFSLAPTFLLHIFIKPLWKNGNYTTVAGIEGIVTIFILPLYLTMFHYYLSKKHQVKPLMFLVNAIIIFFCIWLSAYLGFENWANSIGDKLNPDNDTIEVIGLERTLGYIVSSVGLLIGFLKLKKLNKNFR